MGAAEVESFLTHLAVAADVAAGTQNQALSVLLFLYREVLGIELPWLDSVTRAKRPQRLPTVLTETEVHRVLARLRGRDWLIASLPYATGMRLMGEAACLQAMARKRPNARPGMAGPGQHRSKSLAMDGREKFTRRSSESSTYARCCARTWKPRGQAFNCRTHGKASLCRSSPPT